MINWWGKVENGWERRLQKLVECFLCFLCFVAPSLDRGDSMNINKPQLSLNFFFRWGCRHLPEKMSTVLCSSDRSDSEMLLQAAAVKEDQQYEVYYHFLDCKCKTSFVNGGTAAKCTDNPTDVPIKLIRNRGQEEKMTTAKFLCF